jgi:hypothetical protein
MDGSSKVPHKVLHYLPITDRLQRLYAHEGTAKLMRSHKETPLARSTKMLMPITQTLKKMLGMLDLVLQLMDLHHIN